MSHSPPTPKPLLLSKGETSTPCRSKAKEPGAVPTARQRSPGGVVLPYGGVVLPYGYAYSKAKEPGGCPYSKAAPVPTAVSSLRLCLCRPYVRVEPMCALPYVRVVPTAVSSLCARQPLPLCRPYVRVEPTAMSSLCRHPTAVPTAVSCVLPYGYVEPMCVSSLPKEPVNTRPARSTVPGLRVSHTHHGPKAPVEVRKAPLSPLAGVGVYTTGPKAPKAPLSPSKALSRCRCVYDRPCRCACA